MKHSNKILKQVFGSKKEGLSFLKKLQEDNQLPPALFVYSDKNKEQAKEFIKWLALIVEDSRLLDAENDPIDTTSGNKRTVLMKNIDEVNDHLIDEVVRGRKNQRRTIVASNTRPKVLDYIYDPAFIVAKVDGFDLGQATSELEKLQKALGKV